MKALAKLLIALTLTIGGLVGPSMALTATQLVPVLQVPCAFPGSGLDLNFQTNTAQLYCQPAGLATGQISVARAAATGMVQNLAGLWLGPLPANTARISDKGLLVEEARTNNALWARDFTNAAWVKLNMTAALTQVGIDGTANSATLLTATAGNATVLQTVVLGSAAYADSFWIKRVSGSGTVNITLDGTTFTAASLTTSYQQFQKTATVLNPVIGIQIVTNGDSVAIDAAGLEAGSFATSPILTTTVAVTRNADVPQVIGAAVTPIRTAASAFFQTFGGNKTATNPRMLDLTGVDLILVPTNQEQVSAQQGVNVAAASLGSGTIAGTVKSAFGMDNTNLTAVANGGTKITSAASAWTDNATGAAYLGSNSTGTRQLNGYIQHVVFALPKGIFDNRTAP